MSFLNTEAQHYALPRNKDAPQKLHAMLEKVDRDMCKSWTDDTDALLVFAGLFSAVVTTFSVAVFPWMQTNTPDNTYLLLQHISLQLRPIDPSIDPLPLPEPAIDPPVDIHVARLVNALWFSSLALSLAAALLCILCKQWIRELRRPTEDHDALTSLAIRQIRRRGVEVFFLPQTVSILSLLLQAALGLFVFGLCRLAWELDHTCSIALLIISSGTVALYVVTTVTPLIQYLQVIFRCSFDVLPPQCPWKSPQSWALVRAANIIIRIGIAKVFAVTDRYKQGIDWLPSPLTQRTTRVGTPPRLLMRDKIGSPLSQRLPNSSPNWRLYDVLWTRQHEQSDAGLVSGPSPSPLVSASLVWAVEYLSSPEIPELVYQTLSQSTAQWAARYSELLPESRSLLDEQYQEAYSSRLRVIHHHDPNIVLSDGLFATRVEALETGVGYHDLRSPVTDEPLRCTAYPDTACAYHFTTAQVLDMLQIRGELGLEHFLRFMGAHLAHVQPSDATKDTGLHFNRIAEGAHPHFLAHIEAVISALRANAHPYDWSYWNSLDDLLFQNCVLPLLHHHALRSVEYADDAFDSRPKGRLRQNQEVRVEYLPQVLQYYLERMRRGGPSIERYIAPVFEATQEYIISHFSSMNEANVDGLRRMLLELKEKYPGYLPLEKSYGVVLLVHYARVLRNPNLQNEIVLPGVQDSWYMLVDLALVSAREYPQRGCVYPDTDEILDALTWHLGRDNVARLGSGTCTPV